MPPTCKRRPGGGGAADSSHDGDGSQHTELPPETLATLARISDLDRAWFKRRPDRGHRVRRRIPGEPGLPERGPLVLNLPAYVVLRRGAPDKVAVWGTKQPCGCEDCARTLWATFSPGGPQPTAIAMRVPER